MKKCLPVIICGGKGERLWPRSRQSKPKVFLESIAGAHSLFQQTIQRCQAWATEPPSIITSYDLRFAALKQLVDIEASYSKLMLEKKPCDTALAIALAAFQHRDTTLLVMPADHIIESPGEFLPFLAQAQELAEQGKICVFGIAPSHASSDYGYVKLGTKIQGLDHGFEVGAFCEKPPQDVAQSYLAAGNYRWNSGIYCMKSSSYLDELARLQPQLYQEAERIFEAGEQDSGFSWCVFPSDSLSSEVKPLSIDYAVSEKTSKMALVDSSINWSDLGTWSAVLHYQKAIGEADDLGNFSTGQNHLLQSKNCLVDSSTSRAKVFLHRMQDSLVVATEDAILVSTLQESAQLKNLITHLKEQNTKELDSFVFEERPWGRFDTILDEACCKVKKIRVDPGKRLSLQKHAHRSENWVVVSGQVEVHLDGKLYLLNPSEAIFIPKGSVHSLANPSTTEPASIIEVQTGNYFGEDDIIRLDDPYKRS